MIRGLALTASFLLVGALPALAQTHHSGARTHPPHAPGHERPDSAHHVAMHALLTGRWSGTVTSAQGVTSNLTLSVTHDSLQRMTLTTDAGERIPASTITNLTIVGSRLQWTQDLSGTSCKATAVITPATQLERETVRGKIACADGDRTFILRKTTG